MYLLVFVILIVIIKNDTFFIHKTGDLKSLYSDLEDDINALKNCKHFAIHVIYE